MKNNTKLVTWFGLSAFVFGVPSFADEAEKSIIDGLQLNGGFQITDEATGVVSDYEIAVISRRTSMGGVGTPPPLGQLIGTIPPRPTLNIGLFEGDDIHGPMMPPSDGAYQFPFSYQGLMGIQDQLVVKISLIDYLSMDGGTLVWDTPVDYSALTKLHNGGYSLQLDNCSMAPEITTECSKFTVTWIPNGGVDAKHSSKLENKTAFGKIEYTSMNAVKSMNVEAVVNGVASTPSPFTFIFSGLMYRFKYTGQLKLDEMDD